MPQKGTKKKKGKKKESQEEVDFRIEQLFGSKTRVRMLTLFLEHPDRPFYVREITRKIRSQLNSVRRELKNLIDLDIVLEVEGTIFENEKMSASKKKYYKAKKDGPFFNELRAIMKKALVLMNRSFAKSLKKHGNLELLLVTGRFIDDPEIKTDLLIVGDFDQEVVEKEIEAFEKEIAREVNYTFMDAKEFQYRLDIKDRFVISLLDSDHVMLENTFSDTL